MLYISNNFVFSILTIVTLPIASNTLNMINCPVYDKELCAKRQKHAIKAHIDHAALAEVKESASPKSHYQYQQDHTPHTIIRNAELS